ncbi:MAG TPA: helix-turn-helix domain-containing protein [Rugosimonospora sp.]|nr:helix-turn-helix domain-containing protein [Rugosimonospora sp.]
MENPLTNIEEVEQITDPVERAREAGRRLVAIPEWQERLRKIRRAAVLELRASRYTYAEIGKELGIHRNRVQQIAEGRTQGGSAKSAAE